MLEINRARYVTETQDGGIVSDRKLYVTRATPGVAGAEQGQRVVEAGDADAAYLLASPGDTIPADTVAGLGLEIKDGKVAQKKGSHGAPIGVTINHDQETGPALKKAAEEARKKDLESGRMQTEVAVTEPAPGEADAEKARDAKAKATPAKPAAKKAAKKKAGSK